MRIFVALDLDDAIRSRISNFMDGIREFAPDARWVRIESLHVTLKFIGEQSRENIADLHKALSSIRVDPFKITFCGFGFFPNPKAARVFWIGIESGPQLSMLAKGIDDVCFGLGIPKEDHSFSPHLTLARGASGAPRREKGDKPNQRFERLQQKLSVISAPEFGTMAAREFFLYESQLGPGGSRYTKLHSFPLDLARSSQ